MMKMKVAVVTGAAGGIGRQVAHDLAEDGFHVLLVDRSEGVRREADAINALEFTASALVADLADEAQIGMIVEHVLSGFECCDVLVNNAGVHPKKNGRIPSFEELTLAEWEGVFRVNLSAPFLLCRAFLPGMKKRGSGRIVNIASRAARTFVASAAPHYAASKAGLIGMTRAIAGEYAKYGITANCIAPGKIETAMVAASAPEILAAGIKDVPMGRFGKPSEVSALVRFLASERASYITGAVIDANGGSFIG